MITDFLYSSDVLIGVSSFFTTTDVSSFFTTTGASKTTSCFLLLVVSFWTIGLLALVLQGPKIVYGILFLGTTASLTATACALGSWLLVFAVLPLVELIK